MSNEVPEMPFNEGLMQTEKKNGLNEQADGLLQENEEKKSEDQRFILNG
jgi:hypothetical protein